MEYLLRIHHIAALLQSPRVTAKIERNTRKNQWTDYLHVDVQRHDGDLKTINKKATQVFSSFLFMREDLLEETVRNQDTLLYRRINEIAS